jgi:hypothetical protein
MQPALFVNPQLDRFASVYTKVVGQGDLTTRAVNFEWMLKRAPK